MRSIKRTRVSCGDLFLVWGWLASLVFRSVEVVTHDGDHHFDRRSATESDKLFAPGARTIARTLRTTRTQPLTAVLHLKSQIPIERKAQRTAKLAIRWLSGGYVRYARIQVSVFGALAGSLFIIEIYYRHPSPLRADRHFAGYATYLVYFWQI